MQQSLLQEGDLPLNSYLCVAKCRVILVRVRDDIGKQLRDEQANRNLENDVVDISSQPPLSPDIFPRTRTLSEHSIQVSMQEQRSLLSTHTIKGNRLGVASFLSAVSITIQDAIHNYRVQWHAERHGHKVTALAIHQAYKTNERQYLRVTVWASKPVVGPGISIQIIVPTADITNTLRTADWEFQNPSEFGL